MKSNLNRIFIPIIFSFILGNFLVASLSSQIIIKDVFAHQLFNSSGEKIGNYYVQVATDPEIPTTGQNVKVMLRISSNRWYRTFRCSYFYFNNKKWTRN